ncbi:hypothetical protein BS78_08G141100 [Paspalum vaginatum]|nr:hypothetical protein BS78_08G141100 [Paspalum vaginatum]
MAPPTLLLLPYHGASPSSSSSSHLPVAPRRSSPLLLPLHGEQAGPHLSIHGASTSCSGSNKGCWPPPLLPLAPPAAGTLYGNSRPRRLPLPLSCSSMDAGALSCCSGRRPPRPPRQKPLHGPSVLQIQGAPLCSFLQAIPPSPWCSASARRNAPTGRQRLDTSLSLLMLQHSHPPSV